MLTMKANLPVNNGLQLSGVGVRKFGTSADETLNGSAYNDEIHGGAGRDYINGGNGNDVLFGDAGSDQLNGGNGNDTLDGGADNDTLIGGAGADLLFGGDGFDVASYLTATVGVSIDVAAGGLTNDAAGDRYNSIERFVGSNFGDIMNGDSANNDFEGGLGEDWLFGNGGNDLLFAGAGSDHVRGGDGDDLIEGGTGLDVLTGDAGADVFVFRPGDGADLITDFMSGTDKIQISGFEGSLFGSDGKLAFGYFGFTDSQGTVHSATFANLDSGDQLAYDYITHQLYKIDPLFINGQVANYNPELLATLHYDEAAVRHVSTVDFMVV
jgi:Ca2+-binding RTX toxin-like protein